MAQAIPDATHIEAEDVVEVISSMRNKLDVLETTVLNISEPDISEPEPTPNIPQPVVAITPTYPSLARQIPVERVQPPSSNRRQLLKPDLACQSSKTRVCSIETKSGARKQTCWNCKSSGHSFRNCRLPHSGASHTIVGHSGWEILKQCGVRPDTNTQTQCTVANNTSCQSIGSVSLPVSLEDKCHLIKALIVPAIPHEIILGVDFWIAMDIVPNLKLGTWAYASSLSAEPTDKATIQTLSETQQHALNTCAAQRKLPQGSEGLRLVV
ncbi:hypothetical protein CBL_07181 [Carabus blaptoides fortunei]